MPACSVEAALEPLKGLVAIKRFALAKATRGQVSGEDVMATAHGYACLLCAEFDAETIAGACRLAATTILGWPDLVELRGLCLAEDRRIHGATRLPRPNGEDAWSHQPPKTGPVSACAKAVGLEIAANPTAYASTPSLLAMLVEMIRRREGVEGAVAYVQRVAGTNEEAARPLWRSIEGAEAAR